MTLHADKLRHDTVVRYAESRGIHRVGSTWIAENGATVSDMTIRIMMVAQFPTGKLPTIEVHI